MMGVVVKDTFLMKIMEILIDFFDLKLFKFKNFKNKEKSNFNIFTKKCAPFSNI